MKRRNLAFLTVIGLALAAAGCQATASQSSARIYTDGLAASDSLGGAVYSGSGDTREASTRANTNRFKRAAAANAER